MEVIEEVRFIGLVGFGIGWVIIIIVMVVVLGIVLWLYFILKEG